MTANVCPSGHESSETDFCSVCGARLDPAAARDVAETCPDCASTRAGNAGIFCEACGYNFETGARGLPRPEMPRWQVVVEIDPALRSAESPDPPANFSPATVLLSKESSLIGRLSERRGVFPDVDLTADDAVSHRHALLNIAPGGELVVRDIGSANGTLLNAVDLIPGQDAPLKRGDQITLGHWTRLTIK